MYRIGEGYDVHRLVENRKLILGGVEIPYNKGLLGHSDADVLIHAVMDAIIGAMAMGDIGKFFPDNDLQYKDISSMVLLDKMMKIIDEKLNEYDKKNCINKNSDKVEKNIRCQVGNDGDKKSKLIINNIDATIICQAPKLRPYIDEMRKNIAKTLNLNINQVSVKATTEEGLGFTGMGEGIAARAVCLVEV